MKEIKKDVFLWTAQELVENQKRIGADDGGYFTSKDYWLTDEDGVVIGGFDSEEEAIKHID